MLASAVLVSARPSRAASTVPPFPQWIGRTARLRSTAGDARLLLATDGTGMIAIRAFFTCHPLPVFDWHIAADGQSMRYHRQSALFASRIIEGSASILPGTDQVRWIEAADHLAEFEGFAPAEAARSCG